LAWGELDDVGSAGAASEAVKLSGGEGEASIRAGGVASHSLGSGFGSSHELGLHSNSSLHVIGPGGGELKHDLVVNLLVSGSHSGNGGVELGGKGLLLNWGHVVPLGGATSGGLDASLHGGLSALFGTSKKPGVEALGGNGAVALGVNSHGIKEINLKLNVWLHGLSEGHVVLDLPGGVDIDEILGEGLLVSFIVNLSLLGISVETSNNIVDGGLVPGDLWDGDLGSGSGVSGSGGSLGGDNSEKGKDSGVHS